MNEHSGPRGQFAFRDFSVWRFILISVAILFGFLFQTNAPVQGQSCPAKIRELQLLNPSNTKKNCPRGLGVQECWLICEYVNSRNSVEARLQFKWAVSTPDPTSVTKYACGPSRFIEGGQIHANRQAVVWWTNSAPPLTEALKFAGLDLLKEIGDLAIACPDRSVTVTGGGTQQLPPPPPRCRGGRPMGRIRNPVGKVDLYSYAFDKWKGPITSEFPVYPCDRVRTTGYGSSAVVIIVLPSGLEDRIDLMAETILEIPGVSDWDEQHNTPPSEGFITDLVKGTIRWLTPETPGERRRREQIEQSPFNVRTPTIVVGTRGTDFVLRHDPDLKRDYLLLNSGEVEVAAGGKSVVLGPGQQIFTENKTLSSVYELTPDIWNAVIAQKTIPGANVFASAKTVGSGSDGKDVVTGKTGGGGIGENKTKEPAGARFNVLFKGRQINTLYERSTHEGTPIDVYFFEIRWPDGRQAEQDGQKLWGRFVRYPSVGIEVKDGVIWWYVDWLYKNGRWEAITSKGESFQVVGPAK